MRRSAYLLIVLILCVGLAVVAVAQGPSDSETTKNILKNIDGSIFAVRKGNFGSALTSLNNAESEYVNKIKGYVENFDMALDNRINQSFTSLKKDVENAEISKAYKESQIRELRAYICSATDQIGIGLPSLYRYAIFVIMAASIFLALIVILLVRASVDLSSMRQLKAELSTLGKEMREAYRKKNIKLLHKIRPRYQQLTGRMMGFTFRQMIVTLPPYFLLWWLLGRVYSGWVVAWLPWSGVGFPFLGYWTSCGFLTWLIITYFGFSMVLRRVFLAGL